MELEMYLNGKFIDSINITASQLKNIHELQHQMEKKHCHDLKYSDDQPQFFIRDERRRCRSRASLKILSDISGQWI